MVACLKCGIVCSDSSRNTVCSRGTSSDPRLECQTCHEPIAKGDPLNGESNYAWANRIDNITDPKQLLYEFAKCARILSYGYYPELVSILVEKALALSGMDPENIDAERASTI